MVRRSSCEYSKQHSDSMKEIILIGGGGHCKAVIDVIEQEGEYKIAGIIDAPDLLGTEVLGYPVIGDDANLDKIVTSYKFAFITVGQIKTPAIRTKLFNLALRVGFVVPNIISPYAYVSDHAQLGKGTVIMHGAIVNASAIVGENCIINSNALVEHDSVIEDFCHISTGATINGGVILREGSFVGSGVTTKQDIEIEKYSFVKAGKVVVK